MNKMNHLSILLFLLFSITLAGCDKEDRKSSEMDILAFSFDQLNPNVHAEINGNSILLVVPYGTDVNQLAASIELSDKASISPNTNVKQDFSKPVTYTVTAEDGQTQTYTVEVEVIKNTERDILSFVFNELDPFVTAAIDSETIYAEVVYGTDLTNLAPTVEISSDATILPETGIVTDFSDAVNYTVTAQDGQVKSYEVTVKMLDNTESKISSFSIQNQYRETIIDEENKTILIYAEKGVELSELIPTLEISEEATILPSLEEAQDFSNPIEYTVTAQNQDYQTIYTVNIVLPIEIADSNLELAVRGAMRYSGEPEGYIYLREVSEITKLEAVDKNITDISGIEYLTSLEHLDLTTNKISTLSQLSELENLEVLWLGSNEIVDISALENMTTINNLQLSWNKIVDISMIPNLIELEYLSLGNNPIEAFPSFEKLTKLEFFAMSYVYTDQIYNNGYEFLRGLTSIKQFHAQGTRAKVLSGLESLVDLTHLNLSNTNCWDLSLLENLSKLEFLYLNESINLTQEDIDALQLKLPDTIIEFD
ncbi:MAG: DUF5018 domain-containing protein [Labilibaculum sp.]|nr:DUF5018 domain-containing protein [Labilibaculum sp.]MBI9059449.1 DUF5018 domain-containing protein [Labilibaculum sp.]